jgi:hypothetical protein
MSRLSAGVAIATGSLSADAQGRAIRLNVTKALTVIALLSCVASVSVSALTSMVLTVGCPGLSALVRLVAWLLAVVA